MLKPTFGSSLFPTCILLFGFVYAQTMSAQSDERALVLKTLNFYFDGVTLYDLDALAVAYHPRAHLTYVDMKSGKYEKFEVGYFLSSIAERPHKYIDRTIELLRIDITGNMAFAKTRILFDDKSQRITDYLSLHKMEGEWRIVSRTSYKEQATFLRNRGEWAANKQLIKDQKAVDKVLHTYLKAGETHDLEGFKQAFHQDAAMSFIDPRKGTYHTVSMDDYLDMHANIEGEPYKRQHEILSVDITGNMAVAKLEIRYKKRKASVTDYVYLIKNNGDWTITHKATDKEKMAMNIPL